MVAYLVRPQLLRLGASLGRREDGSWMISTEQSPARCLEAVISSCRAMRARGCQTLATLVVWGCRKVITPPLRSPAARALGTSQARATGHRVIASSTRREIVSTLLVFHAIIQCEGHRHIILIAAGTRRDSLSPSMEESHGPRLQY